MTADCSVAAPGDRAQSNLLALAVALLVLATTTVGAVAVADGALAGADRDAETRRVADALAARLVAAHGPLTTRANVLNASRVATADAAWLRATYSVVGDRAVAVRLDDRDVVTAGTPDSGVTVERLVLVAERDARTLVPSFGSGDAVTLPRRTDRVTVRVDPPAGTRVRTVRANDRVVLHDPAGLDGTYDVHVSRFETVRLAFDASGPLASGDVRLTYYPATTTKARLVVTVGD